MSPERPKAQKANTQTPLNKGPTLNSSTDAVQEIRAFEITIDALSGDYKDAHFLCLEGPNLDCAMKFREQVAHSMRVFQVRFIQWEISIMFIHN